MHSFVNKTMKTIVLLSLKKKYSEMLPEITSKSIIFKT